MKGIKYTAREKRKALQMWIEDKQPTLKVIHKFKCTVQTLYRWKRLYDGTLESLENKSSRPKTPHPNSHTEKEIKQMKLLIKRNPGIGYLELYGEMCRKFAYSRHFMSMYRFIAKNKIKPTKIYDKYVPQEYQTPDMLGVKMQMDVKYVPTKCIVGENIKMEKFYQYTIIDEATRERFIHPYREHSGYSTVDFVKRAIAYFGYIPKTIQTDNGTEFTNPKGAKESKKKHTLDKLLDELGIEHKLIRPYTPRHNGKVERSHRNDQERFYNTLSFLSFSELKDKMQEYLERSNNIPSTALKSLDGKKFVMSPREKRKELIQSLIDMQKNNCEIDTIPRFIKLKSVV